MTPSASAARPRWPLAPASAARTKRRSNSSRAASNVPDPAAVGLGDVPRQRGRADPAAAGGVHRDPRDHVLQLAHVAGPVVARQRGERFAATAWPASRRAPRRPARSARRAAGCRLARSRSGGTIDANDVEAETEVGRGTARRSTSSSRRRLVAATTRTSTRREKFSPDAPDFAFLQHAQQLGLRARRQLADLVEEERAAVRLLEQARRARERRR